MPNQDVALNVVIDGGAQLRAAAFNLAGDRAGEGNRDGEDGYHLYRAGRHVPL